MSDDDWVDVDETLHRARTEPSAVATAHSAHDDVQKREKEEEEKGKEKLERDEEMDGDALARQLERASLEPRLFECFRASHPTHAAALTAFAMATFSLDLVREVVGNSRTEETGEAGEDEALTAAACLANAVLPVVLGDEPGGRRDKGKEKVTAEDEAEQSEDRELEMLMQVLAGENFGHIVNPFADRSGGSLEAVLWAASTARDDADFAHRLQMHEYEADAAVRDRARSIRKLPATANRARPTPAPSAAAPSAAAPSAAAPAPQVTLTRRAPLVQRRVASEDVVVIDEPETDDKYVDKSARPKQCNASHYCQLNIAVCCHCADMRDSSAGYMRYADGVGDVRGSSRSAHYCLTCRSDPHREREYIPRTSTGGFAPPTVPEKQRCRICNVTQGAHRRTKVYYGRWRLRHEETICGTHGLCSRCCIDSYGGKLHIGSMCTNLLRAEQDKEKLASFRRKARTEDERMEEQLAMAREQQRAARWDAANVPRVRTLDEDSLPPISSHAGDVDVGSDSDSDGVLLISMVEPDMLEETTDGSVLVWGSGIDGQLGLDKTDECCEATPLTAFTPDDIVQVDAGRHASFAVDACGRLFCWGGAGLPSGLNTRRPRQIPSEHFIKQVACGDRWNAVLTGEGQVLTWSGGSGEATPTWVRELASVVVAQISSGGAHMLALDEAGRVHAWGEGSDGQLGLGRSNCCMIETPTIVPSFNATSMRRTAVFVAAGGAHSLVLNAIGDVFSFGTRADGRLGRSADAAHDLPRKVAGLGGARIAHVACGRAHSLAVDAEGTVYAWGANESGQLGLGHTAVVKLPARVDLMSPVQAIAAGAGASLAVMENGEVFAWGRHALPAAGAAIVQTVPVLVPNGTGKSCRLAAVGERHALATALPISPLAMDVVQLMGNELLSDVRIECLAAADAEAAEPRVWPGHRVLLARLPGLANVLETRVRTLRFDAGTEDVVEALLAFVYGDDETRWTAAGVDALPVASLDADGRTVGQGTLTAADVRRARGLHEYLAKMAKAARYPTAFASDMCIVSGDGVRFAVHRALLAVRSTVFHAMMYSGMAEGSAGGGGDMHVDEPAAAVEAVLRFVYTNLPALEQETAMDVMALAHRWSLGSLLQAWQHFVVPLVDVDNAVQLLVLADVYGAHAVRTAALATIRANREAVAASGVLETDLVPAHLATVVQDCIAVRDKRVRPSVRAARRAHELLLDDDVANDASDSDEFDWDEDWDEDDETAAQAPRRRSDAHEDDEAADEEEEEEEWDADEEVFSGHKTLAEKIRDAAAWIRPARERRHLSLGELAQRAAVNPTVLRRIEAFKVMPAADVLARLRKVLHGR